MKKVFSLILSLCLVLPLCIPSVAFAKEVNPAFPSGQYDVVTVGVNGRALEVPVIKETEGTSRAADGMMVSNQTVFIPIGTEDSLAQNARLVSEIKEYGGPRTRGYGDFYDGGYMWFHSTLNYTTSVRDGVTYFDLISFKLEREIYVESVYNDFNKASARAAQIGAKYGGGVETLTQEKNYSDISYGSLYSLPGSWEPVYNVGYHIGVEYSVLIDYNNNLGMQDYTLTYFHQAV